jgi:hypothetical protein
MMYHAQECKVPGLNAPIDTPAAKKYFWMPLSTLARDAAYDSKDTEFLKAQLEELGNIKLLLENERQWTSERMVASVTLVNPQGFKKHSGQVWFGYAFPPEVHELVMAPGTYTRLNIFYQGLLRSGTALALYEICRRYASNPSRRTLIETYEHWYGVLTGNAVGLDDPPPYKYFKRDVIKPAIAQINSLTDINIELIEHKNGRRVDRLQFFVEAARQPQLEFPAPPVIDLELIGRVMKFGFSQLEASELVAQHGEVTIITAAAFVEGRLGQQNSPKLDSPAAYFRWTLKSGKTPAQELLQQSGAKPKAPKARDGQNVMEKFLAARANEALEVFKELDDGERKPIFERFAAQHGGKGIKLDKGIDSAVVKAMVGQWYAQELWGEPSAADVARFVEQSAMTPGGL